MTNSTNFRLVFFAFLLVGSAAFAQDWPSRPVTVVVPFSAGNGVDLIARALSAPMSKRLGQPIVVDDRPGASSVIGTTLVANAKPDGHTLLLTAGSIISDAAVHQRDDPIKEFTPVVLLTTGQNCFIVGPRTSARSVKEVEAIARAYPGKLFYSSGGAGVVHHLAMALFQNETGVDVVHVPHKGETNALQSVAAGLTEMMILPVAAAAGAVKAGQVRMLAVLSNHRSKIFPEVPTMPELGYPKVTYESYYLALAPLGTPRPVVSRLNADFVGSLRELVQEKVLDKFGLEMAGGSPEELSSLLKTELVKMRKLVADAKIKSD